MDAQPEIIVVPAHAGNLDAIAAVWHGSASSMDGAPDVPPLGVMRERIDEELRSDWDLYVARRGERVVGMLALRPGVAILDQIFVLPDAQGEGVGTALLGCAKQAMPSGFTLRMAASNLRARRFYERNGLRPLGEGLHPGTGLPVRFYGWNIA